MEAEHGAEGYATQKAIAISKAMRKITEMVARQRICLVFTNQLRQKMGFTGYGDQYTTSGGKALGFHASVRLRLKSTGQIRIGDKTVGIKTKATVIKNRMGPPMRSVEFDIFFDRGIDNFSNWLDILLEEKIIVNAKKEKEDPTKKTKKSKKELEEEKEADKKAKSLQFALLADGKEPEIVAFEKKAFPQLLQSRPDVRDFLYSKLCSSGIMTYQAHGAELQDDIEYDAPAEGSDE